MKTEINIDDYLSFEEKKEIAREAFASEIRRCVSKNKDGVFGDAETLRVIGNITHSSVCEIMKEYIPDFENQIRNSTKEIVDKNNYSYYIFHKADAWGSPNSQAIKWINDVVNESKDLILEKAKNEIMKFVYADAIKEGIIQYLGEQQESLYRLESILSKQLEEK